MNWIPKEKAHAKKPSEKDKIKEYFRKHRRTLATAATEVAAQKLDGTEHGKRSRSRSNSRTPGSSSPNRSLSPKPESMSSQPCSSGRFKRGTPVQVEQLPLADMDLRGLAEVIRDPSNVSTDLVHLELMKRMFGYRPRTEPDPSAADQASGYLASITNDTYQSEAISRSLLVNEEVSAREVTAICPENLLHWTDPSFSGVTEQNQLTSNFTTDDNQTGERSVEVQSEAGSSYWDLTDLTRATNPRQLFPQSFLPF